MSQRKKLIEVALPLDAINEASKQNKSPRPGYSSTLHVWWARRPLAACRAVLFAQLVDDPSSVPEEFPDEAAQETERRRLFRIVEELVRWENSNDARVIGAARREIAHSVARSRSEAPPGGKAEIDAFLAEKAPPVVDPFCGGGSIPLEAQRLGLRAHGSDLNPVAVLITKALVEVPPRFAGLPPVNPEARAKFAAGAAWNGRDAEGLAEDVHHYGGWMREEAERRIGHLYPKVEVTPEMVRERPDLKAHEGRKLTVIAWLWARTVASPNPATRGAHVPLVSSFVLSSKKGREAIVVPVVKRDGYRFTVKSDELTLEELTKAKAGTKVSRGSFLCMLSGAPIPYSYIDDEANAGRMHARLMAIVAEGDRRRIYLSPDSEQEEIARSAESVFKLKEPARGTFASNAQGRIYGFKTFGDYFTDRQLVSLTTFSDLVSEARETVLRDALAAGMDSDALRLADDGTGAQAYADAVATYLGFALSKVANIGSSMASWMSDRGAFRETFARQAIPMVWDFAEAKDAGVNYIVI